MIKVKDVNPNPAEGGPYKPTSVSKNYSSGTKCRIDLRPGCKFKLVRCPKVYKKKLTNLEHERTLAGPFL